MAIGPGLIPSTLACAEKYWKIQFIAGGVWIYFVSKIVIDCAQQGLKHWLKKNQY